MSNPIRKAAVFSVVLLLSAAPSAGSQHDEGRPNEASSRAVEYKPGQVWKTDLGATVTVLKVEDVHKVGKVVHVRIDNILLQSCGDVHLTTGIDHIALTETMMRKNALDLMKSNVDLPNSYFEAYTKWEKQKKHQILKVPLQEAIRSVVTLPGPMNCDHWGPQDGAQPNPPATSH